MRQPSNERRSTGLHALSDGNSVNSTARLCGASKVTILRLLADAGTLCASLHGELFRDLQAERIQADELWSFVRAKDKNLSAEDRRKSGLGSVWTWTAAEADTKRMIACHVGDRGESCCNAFIADLASRLDNRVQLTTDGHAPYVNAVRWSLGSTDHPVTERRDTSPASASGSTRRAGRRSPPRGHQCVVRRANQPLGAHAEPTIHAVGERAQRAVREPLPRSGCSGVPLHPHPQSRGAADYPCGCG